MNPPAPPADVTRQGDDRVLLITRVVHGLLAIVVIPFFIGLTFFPGDTAGNFAWPLAPKMSAMLFGSLYLTVIYSFGRVVFARKWHHVALVVWATLPVLVMLGAVTLLYWSRFNRGQPPFHVWFVAYVGLPPVLAAILLVNRRRDPHTPDAVDVVIPRWTRLTTVALGAVFAAVGAGLLMAPGFMATVWPWPVKPLAARAIGCLFLAPAVAHFVAVFETRWSALRIVTQSAIIWFAAILVAVVRTWPEFDRTRPLTWGFVAFLVAELGFSVVSYVALEAKRRRASA